MAKRGFELVGSQREAYGFLTVAVQDGRQPAGAAKPLVVPFTKGFAFFDFKCFGHGNTTRKRGDSCSVAARGPDGREAGNQSLCPSGSWRSSPSISRQLSNSMRTRGRKSG